VFCIKCGSESYDVDFFCINCGENLENAELLVESEVTTNSKNLVKSNGVMAIVSLSISFLGLYFLLGCLLSLIERLAEPVHLIPILSLAISVPTIIGIYLRYFGKRG
jgi:uncharacterized membrane protein YvbJ